VKLLRLSWRRELLLLTVALMEVCWIQPWTRILVRLTERTQEDISALVLFVLLLFALYLTRSLSRMDIPLAVHRLVTIGMALLTMSVFLWFHFYSDYHVLDWRWVAAAGRHALDFSLRVPFEWSAFLIVAYLWWRGIGFAQKRLSPESVGFYFRWGIVAQIWFHFVALMWGSLQDVYPLIFGFFFSGLLAVALSRAEDVSQTHAGIHSPFNASWLGILLGGTLLALVAGGALASVLSVSGVQLLLQWLQPILSILRQALSAVIIALAYLLQPLMWLFVRIGERFLGDQFLQELESQDELLELLPTDEQIAATPWYLHALKILVLLLIVAIVLLVVYWTVNRRREGGNSGRREERESVWSAGDLRQDLLSNLRARLQKIRDGLASLGQLSRERYSFVSVRRVYASVVKAATRAGYPRPSSSTPYEHMSILRQAFPGHVADVQSVTEAYIRAHYGEVPFSSEELDRVRKAGSRLIGFTKARPAAAQGPDPGAD
jgi:hypothetical protein